MEVVSFRTKEKLEGTPVSVYRDFDKTDGCTDIDIVADEDMMYIPLHGDIVFTEEGECISQGSMFRTTSGAIVMHHPTHTGLIVPVVNKKLLKTFEKKEKEFNKVAAKFQELLKFAQDNKIRVRKFTDFSVTYVEKKSVLSRVGCTDVFNLLRSTGTIDDDGYIIKTDTVPMVNWMSIKQLEQAEEVMKG